MKARVHIGPRRLEIQELAELAIQDDDVRVKLRALVAGADQLRKSRSRPASA